MSPDHLDGRRTEEGVEAGVCDLKRHVAHRYDEHECQGDKHSVVCNRRCIQEWRRSRSSVNT